MPVHNSSEIFYAESSFTIILEEDTSDLDIRHLIPMYHVLFMSLDVTTSRVFDKLRRYI